MIHQSTGRIQPCLPLELATSPVVVLGRLGHEIKKWAIDEFEAAGASLYEYSVLAALAEGASETQASIADRLKLDRGQLVGLLDSLEERALIERRRDPNDRRRHMVTLTAAGRRELEKLRAVVRRLEDEFLAPLDAESREQLYRLLYAVACHHDARFVRPEDVAAAVS